MATDEILEALRNIAREKSVDRQLLVETLQIGLLSAAKKKYATAADVEVGFDDISGEIRVRVHKKVVQVAIDMAGEIDLEEALELDPTARLGSTIPVEVPIAEMGRNAIQAAKQVLVQRVREAERENVYEEYVDRVGQVLSGTVSQVDRGSVIVKIGKTEAIIPPREVINRDRFKIGDPVRALLLEVDRNQRGPQLILSRTHPDFVRRLFENEVPEIFERVVEIREIAREPGSRTKISVISHDDRVDPVGACVGMKGARVQSIVRELGGERIDIVPWSPDPKVFVTRALSPARVLDISVDEQEKRVTIVVSDDQLSYAIGTRGQNARLAHRLTGYSIDLRSQSQMQAQAGAAGGVPELELEDLQKELGPRTVERLIKAGKETLQDVMRTSVDELMAIPGIGEKTASRLLTLGGQILEERLVGGTGEEAPEEEAQTQEADAKEPSVQEGAEEEEEASARAASAETTPAEEAPAGEASGEEASEEEASRETAPEGRVNGSDARADTGEPALREEDAEPAAPESAGAATGSSSPEQEEAARDEEAPVPAPPEPEEQAPPEAVRGVSADSGGETPETSAADAAREREAGS
jgi:N utilization substance protein A